MPKPFLELTLDQFADLVSQFPWKRRISEVHVHHTWRPNHADFFARPAIQSIEAMYRYHTTQAGFSDIAQHITIDPLGHIWTGRNWNQQPASSAGFNGNSAVGPFMFEMIGDFDQNRDKWEGAQHDAAIEVIALIQRHWSLPPTAFRFHNEMNPKSCPGTSIDKVNVGQLVEQAHARLTVPSGARALEASKDRDTVDRILQLFSVTPGSRALADEGELLESDMTSRDISLLNAAPGAVADRDADMRDLTPEDFKLLRAHVINLRMGALSAGGVFTTSPEDVEAIFAEHLPDFMKTHPTLRLVFFAHGGLNEEIESLKNARNRIDFYKQNNCYPIFFVWETGVKETLFDILSEIIGVTPQRDITDTITNFTDPALEAAFRNGGFSMWANMKLSAERAFLTRQGGTVFVDRLTAFWKEHSASMEIHAIGHSAGSIFHAHFLNLLCSQPANPPIKVKTLHFLAPAITVDLFNEKLTPLLGGRVEQMTEYTMHKDFELADSVGPYRKSLLYLVSRSFEDRPEMPILGLEDSIRRDPDLMRLFGFIGKNKKAEILFSIQENGPRNSTISKKHGDFDNDRLTMAGVMRRILNTPDDQSIVEFSETVSRTVFDSPKVAAPTSVLTPVPFTPAAPAVIAAKAKGQKVALCIGIDAYAPPNTLAGCVNDAKAWAAWFTGLGFRTQSMLNADATWQNIRETLAQLIANAKSGSVIAVQYAGHGTRVNDLDGDEPSGRDSALCPVDFPNGGFLIDDDLREIFGKLPNGVNLTCFFDCCHSGTITRLVAPTPVKLGGDVRVRGLHADDQMEEAHRQFRQALHRGLAVDSAPRPRGPAGMREISFSACTDSQTAKEIDGHGVFTTRALKLLSNGTQGLTNSVFLKQVTTAFGSDLADQTPGLDCVPAVKTRALLAPLV